VKKFEFTGKKVADAQFRAYGSSLEEAFANAALAMASIMYDYVKIKPAEEREIKIEGNDLQSLLYNFLEEILFLLDTENFLLHSVKEIKIKNNQLEAVLVGDTKVENYELFGQVKAVTYNEMKIEKEKDIYMVQVVVDIWFKRKV